jgi:uncharacterized protein involved in exopolysaccharide biosynthesis
MIGTLKELYEETVESQIRVWDDEIEQLGARADIILARIESGYYNRIKCLRNKEKSLKQQLEDLKAISEADASWHEISELLARTTEDMKSAIDQAAHEIEPI